MSVELKPCPFCGGTASIVQPGTRRQSCVVECDSCGLSHDSGDEGEHCGKSWNRRDGDRAIEAAAIERCAKVCERHYDKNRPDFTRDPYITTLQCAAAIRALLPKEE